MLNCGFAEIYWANVPRVPAADKHILEEPRKWARTLVERLRLNSRSPGSRQQQRANDERVGELLEEMIDGVTVADRIASLADKAGLFKFDLNGILNDFLNDVQVVAEFEDYREQLLKIFGDVMEKIHRYFYASEIYVVAHSEGTVVSFMGLLKGLYERAPWAGMVRGYMTIGCPLNKHVYFWPELFDQFDASWASPPDRPIPWKNYYDYGDPIGYNLEPTRQWIAARRWDKFFAFSDSDDFGFTRYYFPGEAHNEYWSDADVFGHFLQTVVDPKKKILDPPVKVPYKKPTTRPLAWVTSYIVPYVLSAGLLFVACYILYKAVHGTLDPIGSRFDPPGQELLNVAALWGLVGGMSLLARIPRLGAHAAWWVLAVFLGVGFSFTYFGLSEPNRGSIEQFLVQGENFDVYNRCLLASAFVLALIAWSSIPFRAVAGTLVPIIFWILFLRISFSRFANVEPGLNKLPLNELAVCSLVLALVLRAFVWLLDRSATDFAVAFQSFIKGVAWTLLAMSLCFAVPQAVALVRPEWGKAIGSLPLSGIAVLSVAWAIGLSAWAVSWHYPGSGTRPLVHTGGLIILLVVLTQLNYHQRYVQGVERVEVVKAADRLAGEVVRRRTADLKTFYDRVKRIETNRPLPGVDESDPIPKTEWPLINAAAGLSVVVNESLEEAPIWPVFLAGAAFLYVWWLAIIAFDLTFIWHLYVRYAGATKLINDRLEQSGALAYQCDPAVPPRPFVSSKEDFGVSSFPGG